MTIDSSSHQAQPVPVALFVSDLHLQESHPKTTEAFLRFLSEHAAGVQALYLLGDIFEYWAGDDDLSHPFIQKVVDAIHALHQQGVSIYWMDGNRDFLAGTDLMRSLGAARLPDPYVAVIGGKKFLLSHGDAYCTDDLAYMKFREQVRNPAWQKQFLDLPLAERKKIIAGVRQTSRQDQASKSAMIMDVNSAAIEQLLEETCIYSLIHGHTHRPAKHEGITSQGLNFVRYVLPDWEFDEQEQRGGWLAVCEDGSVQACDFGSRES